MLKVAILDDYQNVSQQFVDLEKLAGKYEIKIFSKPFEDDADALADCNTCPRDAEGNAISTVGKEEWKKLFGGEVVGSQYQDGHFVYQVVKGGGTGDDAYPPVLYVADIENATHFNNVLEP